MRRTFENNIGPTIRTTEAAFPGGTRVSRPAGGFVLWLELPKPFESRLLFDRAFDEGICFAPSDVFSVGRRYGNCLRLSCGHRWDTRIETGPRRWGEMAHAALVRRPGRHQ
jgi:DNA-binding transcriptional MocR family regulator